MFDRVTKIVAVLAIALGAAHILFGVVTYRALTADLIWFAGAGMAMICAGQSCLTAPRRCPAIVLVLYLGLMAVIMPSPQVFAGFGLFLWLTIASLRPPRAS